MQTGPWNQPQIICAHLPSYLDSCNDSIKTTINNHYSIVNFGKSPSSIEPCHKPPYKTWCAFNSIIFNGQTWVELWSVVTASKIRRGARVPTSSNNRPHPSRQPQRPCICCTGSTPGRRKTASWPRWTSPAPKKGMPPWPYFAKVWRWIGGFMDVHVYIWLYKYAGTSRWVYTSILPSLWY